MDKMFVDLSAPFSGDAVQRTKKEQTRKGYDTTGVGYQWIVNRFNEALGSSWGFHYKIIKETEGMFANNKPYHEVTVEVSIWVLDPSFPRACVGSHISSSYGDALKGAITNAFKKTAAFWGVGKQAYEGTLDDDTAYEAEIGHRPAPAKAESTDKGRVPEPKHVPSDEKKKAPEMSPSVKDLYGRLLTITKGQPQQKEMMQKMLLALTSREMDDTVGTETVKVKIPGVQSFLALSDKLADVAIQRLEAMVELCTKNPDECGESKWNAEDGWVCEILGDCVFKANAKEVK